MVEERYSVPRGQRAATRASDADRDRAVEFLKTAYSVGRLTKDEHDSRVDEALSARTYGDLDRITADLPATGPTMAPSAAAKTNAFAIASLTCGLGQFAFGLLATIPAIVFGHMARRQIRRTGEQGGGLALAGLILGWGMLILVTALVIVILTVARSAHVQT